MYLRHIKRTKFMLNVGISLRIYPQVFYKWVAFAYPPPGADAYSCHLADILCTNARVFNSLSLFDYMLSAAGLATIVKVN